MGRRKLFSVKWMRPIASETQKNDVVQSSFRKWVCSLGAEVWAQWKELRHAAAIIGTVVCASIHLRCWVPTVRKAFARQILAIGVEPL